MHIAHPHAAGHIGARHRHAPHISHINVETALQWIAKSAVPRAYLTNLHVDLDYEELDASTPSNVHPAHDGLVLEYPI